MVLLPLILLRTLDQSSSTAAPAAYPDSPLRACMCVCYGGVQGVTVV
jgi:hypothetical protein